MAQYTQRRRKEEHLRARRKEPARRMRSMRRVDILLMERRECSLVDGVFRRTRLSWYRSLIRSYDRSAIKDDSVSVQQHAMGREGRTAYKAFNSHADATELSELESEDESEDEASASDSDSVSNATLLTGKQNAVNDGASGASQHALVRNQVKTLVILTPSKFAD